MVADPRLSAVWRLAAEARGRGRRGGRGLGAVRCQGRSAAFGSGTRAVLERCADVSFEPLELVDERRGVGADLPRCGADGSVGHGFAEAVKPRHFFAKAPASGSAAGSAEVRRDLASASRRPCGSALLGTVRGAELLRGWGLVWQLDGQL